MKHLLLAVILFSSFLMGNAQQQQTKVDVTYWGGRAIMIVNNYWEPVKDQLTNQLSDSLFQYIQLHCQEKGWPAFFGYESDEEKSNNQEAVFNKLIKYKVASFDNIRNGQNFGRDAIICIPWKENSKLVDIDAWNYDIYFIVPDKHVVEKK